MEKRNLHLQKKVIPILFILLLSAAGMTKGFAYDFSAVCETGQTLYYTITDAENHYVELTYPGTDQYNGWWGYTKPIGDLVLPENVQYDGLTYSVTSIGYSAFYYCSGLTSIEIPNSVTSIGNSAFSGCTGLTSIEIPNSVTSIGNFVFTNCSSLTSVEIPNSVTSIGYSAFYHCTSLTSIEIPNSVTSIGDDAFSLCSSLEQIIVDSGNTVYDSRDNCNAIIKTNTNILVLGCKNTVIPNSVTSIGYSAFYYCSGLTSIEIPNSVTSIGDEAFSNCTSLTSIEIPNSVTSISIYAFQNCRSLEQIIVASGNTVFDSRDNCNAIIETSSNILVLGCKNTVIPNSVTSINHYAFSYCVGLTSIEIPNSVTYIGSYAFIGCTGLTSIEIPNSVTSIGNSAFSGCTGLTSIEIPNSVTIIRDEAFSGCSGLASITVHAETPPTIYFYTFYNCPKSIPVYVPCGKKSAYRSKPYWNLFTNIIEMCPSEITATANPSDGGTVTGAGTYDFGTTITLTATANEGYAFTNWTENGEVVSTEAEYTFTVTGDRTLVANFVELTNHYIPQGSAYSETMALYGVIQIDGVEQHSGLLEVGAFCGDECRGSAIASEFEITHRYLAILNIFGESGHQLTFKLYDHGLGEELELTSPAAITFDVDGYGNPIEPYILNFISTVAITATLDPEEAGTVTGTGDYAIGATCTLTATANEGYQFKNWTLNGEVVSTEASYSFTVSGEAAYVAHFHYVHTQALATGWNWWSTYIEQEGIDGLEMLENSIGIAGVRIQGRDGITDQFEYQGTNYWYGSLNALANEQMYKIRTNADCNAVIVGDLASPSNHPITISNGWNWIGYPCGQSQSLDEVMSGFTPEANDVIKGRNGSSTFISYGSYNFWYGTLTVLEPGQGYMYKSNGDETKTLTFQTERGNAVGNAAKEDGFFTPNTADYSSNMLVTAVVEMDGQELRSEEYELAAFVGDECRGSVRLMYVEPLDRYVAFLLVYGDEPEEVRFVLTDGNEVVCSGDCLTYAPDGIEGTPTEPVTLHFGTLGLNESGQDVVNIFPNPSNGVFGIEGKGVRKIEVVDAYGQMILSKETQNDFERIDLSGKADGLYLLRVVTSNGITTKQLIKK